jgi:cyclic pyranopterin phosphate synthase
MSEKLSHISDNGEAQMVDVGNKTPTVRTARAKATVNLGPKIAELLRETGAVSKGNVIETARIAGIMAAKRTHEMIPMCHPLSIDQIKVDMELKDNTMHIETFAKCTGVTGIEMEAMTAASVAALTVYDMCKSADKGIIIESIQLIEKTGGKSGDWRSDNG